MITNKGTKNDSPSSPDNKPSFRSKDRSPNQKKGHNRDSFSPQKKSKYEIIMKLNDFLFKCKDLLLKHLFFFSKKGKMTMKIAGRITSQDQEAVPLLLIRRSFLAQYQMKVFTKTKVRRLKAKKNYSQ